MEVLRRKVTELTAELELLRRQRLEAERLEALAFADELTGVLNRRGFRTRADGELERARDLGYRSLVLFFDVDAFKAVNDRCGHAMGDRVLQGVARSLQKGVRGVDLVGRIGGDEFVVLALDAGLEHVGTIRSRIELHLIRLSRELDLPLSLSMGAVEVPGSGAPPVEALLAEADRRMYEEKVIRRAARD